MTNPVLAALAQARSHTLTTAEMPSHSHANTLTDPGHTHGTNAAALQGGSGAANGGGYNPVVATINSATTGITINNASAGGGAAHAIVQPTIIANKILRII